MAYESERFESGLHRIVLEDREQLTVSGVEEVESFDDAGIVMVTARGTLVVRGRDLHIEQLSLDGGQLRVEGYVESMTYENEGGERTGLLARLFR